MIKVLLTREPAASYRMAKELQTKGWQCISQPFLQTVQRPLSPALQQYFLGHIEQSSYLIVTSPNAVKYCPPSLLAAIKKTWQGVWVMGAGTHQALKGMINDALFFPYLGNSENFAKALAELKLSHSQQLFMLTGVGGRRLIPRICAAQSVSLEPCAVYQRTLPSITSTQIQILKDTPLLVPVFTCTTAIKNMLKRAGKENYAWVQNLRCVVVSERIAKYATRVGWQKITQAKSVLPMHIDEALKRIVSEYAKISVDY